MSASKIVLTITVLLVLFIIYEAAVLINHTLTSKKLSANAKAYQQPNPNAKYSVLFIGDSTGVGTGAEDPTVTVAGYLGKDHPNYEITNLAKNGAHAKDLVANLNSQKDKKFNLIVINVGGNDILQFVNLDQFTKDLSKVLDLAKTMSDNVVLFTTGDVGKSRFFPPLVGKIFTARALKVRQIAKDETKQKGLLYVDLFENGKDLTFDQNMHSADQLHLNGAGYQYWYKRLLQTLDSANIKLP